jgi:hypothetical protein
MSLRIMVPAIQKYNNQCFTKSAPDKYAEKFHTFVEANSK